MPRNSFEKFYLEKAALGEGCRCAEMVVTQHELEENASRRDIGERLPPVRVGPWRRFRRWLAARLTG
ncbi:MAG: hypothetical protein GY791_11390 [Alphaproteobacteria bacterium]|nr:hypothetical protein [Alphaproteobacteria bacterium]